MNTKFLNDIYIYLHTNHKKTYGVYEHDFVCLSLSFIREILKKIFLFVGKHTIQHKDLHSLADPAFASARFPLLSIHSRSQKYNV